MSRPRPYILVSPDDPAPEAIIACLLAAAEVSDRLRGGAIAPARIPEPDAHMGAFARMESDRLREVSAKGGRGPRRPRTIRNPMTRYGLTVEEFWEYGKIMAKGFSSQEAAEIVIRSRRPTTQAEG